MQISPINYSYAPSFAAIKSLGSFTEKQTELDMQLKNVLNEPNKSLKNKTPTNYYGKKGYDFVIQPLSNDAVELSMRKDMKIIGTGINRSYTWSEEIHIGEYNDNAPLVTEDIIGTYKSHKSNQNMLIGILGFATAAMIFLCLSHCRGAKSAALESAGKAGETIDSMYNKFTNIVLK